MNVSESMKCEPLWDVQCRILSQIAGQINGRYISYGYNLYWICFFFFIFFIQIYWNTLFCLRQTFQLKQKKTTIFSCWFSHVDASVKTNDETIYKTLTKTIVYILLLFFVPFVRLFVCSFDSFSSSLHRHRHSIPIYASKCVNRKSNRIAFEIIEYAYFELNNSLFGSRTLNYGPHTISI